MPEYAPLVFISYSRANRDFARGLYKKLESLGYHLWRDLNDLEPGKGWWPQIQEAIEVCQTMILCMSPTALASPFVTDEWRYARQLGKRVIPVIAANVDFEAVPHWMKKAEWLDFRIKTPEAELAWQRLLNTMNTEYIPRRVPFTVPPELYDREHFVDRPAEYMPLKKALLSEGRQNPVAITTVLHGGGGFGKTTLAAALCYDDHILSAFDDGILWVSLGQTPDLARLMGGMYRALTGDEPGFKSVDEATPALAERLKGRDCLLVVDDVWSYAHVKPFLKLGDRSACLVTTRQFQIAVEAGAVRVNVDEMTTDQAVQMLVARLDLSPADLGLVRALAARLGEWPLLLEIVSGILRVHVARTQDAIRALEWVNKALDKRGVTGIVREDEEDRKRGVAETLAVSIALLEPEEQAHYYWLAVFPEDAAVPLDTLETLWSLDDFDTEERVRHLADLSLLRWDFQISTIRLHDVVRKTLEEQLGEDAPRVHAHLLDVWGKGWNNLPNDYAWNHYVYHLHGAGRDDELCALFANQRWMQARFEHDGYTYTGYIADLMLVWEQNAHIGALAQAMNGVDPTALACCVRYALIRTSINSVVANYKLAFVARAVEIGMWSVSRALGIARMTADAEKRARLYTELLSVTTLSPIEAREAAEQGLAAALVVESEDARTTVLAGLVHELSRRQTATSTLENVEPQAGGQAGLVSSLEVEQVATAFTAALAIHDAYCQAKALTRLIDFLNDEQVIVAFSAALLIEDERARKEVLSDLDGKLDKTQSAMALVTGALAIREEGARAEALVGLADKLEGEQVAVALTGALAIREERARAEALVGLADKLEGEQVAVALTGALAIREEETRAKALAGLADRLVGEQITAALTAALAVREEGARARALVGLADKLEGEQITAALTGALAVREEGVRARLLAELAGKLEGEQVAVALTGVLAIWDRELRAEALTSLVDRLEGKQVAVALTEALAIRDEKLRAEALVGLAERLEGEQVAVALTGALAIQKESVRAEALVGLAERLEGEQVAVALTGALAIREERARAEALAGLAERLEGEQVTAALAGALAIQEEDARANALAGLADRLEGEQVTTALTGALAIWEEEAQAKALVGLADRLEDEQVTAALTAVLAMKKVGAWGRALVGLAGKLEGEQVSEALTAAKKLRDEWLQAEVLTKLAERIEGEQVATALAAALAIRHEGKRAEVLAELAGRLEDKHVGTALAGALAIQDEEARERALAGLAGKLEGDQISATFDAVLAFNYEGKQARALAGLADKLEGEQVATALRMALSFHEEEWQAQVLARLGGKLEGKQVATALVGVLTIQGEEARARALAGLAGNLEGEQIAIALREALDLKDEKARTEVLTVLAEKLEGDPVETALGAILTVQDARLRTQALAGLVNKLPYTQKIEVLAHALLLTQNAERSSVLEICAEHRLFGLSSVPASVLAAIAGHIIEICNDWQWM